MRALHRIADQPGAVERGGGSDALGVARGGGERVRPAHAITVRADRAGLGTVLTIEKRQHGGHVIHHRRDRHFGPHRAHALMLRAAMLEHLRPVDRVAPGAVVEIGQQHAVADRREPPRHVAQLIADAGRVHQEEHGRMHAALGPTDEGFHRPVTGGDVKGLLDHVWSSLRARARLARRRPRIGSTDRSRLR